MSAQRIAEHGRACRPPVPPATRAAALATATNAAAAAERRRELDAQNQARREQDTHATLLAQAHAHQAARAGDICPCRGQRPRRTRPADTLAVLTRVSVS